MHLTQKTCRALCIEEPWEASVRKFQRLVLFTVVADTRQFHAPDLGSGWWLVPHFPDEKTRTVREQKTAHREVILLPSELSSLSAESASSRLQKYLDASEAASSVVILYYWSLSEGLQNREHSWQVRILRGTNTVSAARSSPGPDLLFFFSSPSLWLMCWLNCQPVQEEENACRWKIVFLSFGTGGAVHCKSCWNHYRWGIGWWTKFPLNKMSKH